MNKKVVLIFVAGWLLALVLPPQRIAGYIKGGS